MGHPRQQLNGPQGLSLAVIDQAVRDLKAGGAAAKSARAYFFGPIYKHHLQSLGLPSDMLPEVLKEENNMTEYLYAGLTINEQYTEGSEPAHPAQQNNDAGEWEYVGLVINAGKPEQPTQPEQAANRKQARRMQYFTQKTGYVGNGAK